MSKFSEFTSNITNLLKGNTSILLIGILLSLIIGILLKKLLNNFKNPERKKGSIVSLEIILAFGIISSLYMSEGQGGEDTPTILLILIGILGYLIAKTKYDAKEYYFYQIVLSIIVGLAGPYIIRNLGNMSERGSRHDERSDSRENERSDEDNEKDHRREATEKAPELSLEEEELLRELEA